MPLLHSFLIRLLIALVTAVVAFALMFTGAAPLLRLALVGAASVLPMFVFGSMIWGPRGLGARLYGMPTRVRLPQPHLVHGLALVALGTVMAGHYSVNPNLASIGFLIGFTAIEARITVWDFRRYAASVETAMPVQAAKESEQTRDLWENNMDMRGRDYIDTFFVFLLIFFGLELSNDFARNLLGLAGESFWYGTYLIAAAGAGLFYVTCGAARRQRERRARGHAGP